MSQPHFDLVGRPYDESIALKDVLQAGYGKKASQNNLKQAGYNLDKELSNHNQQIFYNKEKKHLIFNVAGTHNLNDVGTDFLLGIGKLKSSNRYKSAKKSLTKAKQKYEDSNVDVVGHSLGGAIAQYVGSKNDHVTTFNKGATIGQKTRKNEVAYRTKNDPVSLLVANSKRVHIIKNRSKNKGLIGAHSTDSLDNSIIL